MTDTLPWFRYSRNSRGDWIVTWWVSVRNARGTSTLQPRAVSFSSELEARNAGSERAHAKKVTIRYQRNKEQIL